jgi:AraC-like DNA-binding protein
MALIRYRPTAPLDRHVECFWWSRRAQPDPHAEHMLPSGRAQLVFAMHETPIAWRAVASGRWTDWSRCIVHGPQSSFYIAGPKPAGVSVGVSFRPGAAGAVLGVSLEELADRHVELASIWGSRGLDLHHQLMTTREPERAFRILEENLLARIYRPLLLHPAVGQALAAPAGSLSSARVANLQRASGYSPKHFINLFRLGVGIRPKHYYRIRRFNCVVEAMAAGRHCGLGDLAAAAGYSDQAHLTRDFKEFAGVTPTQYQPSAADRPLHHRAAEGPRGPGK